jgi:hypothetical protein
MPNSPVYGENTSTDSTVLQARIGIKMRIMAKKTKMSDSSLWIIAIVLLALTAWMYFKR